MLSIPNYCRRNANQNDKKWNPTSQNGHSHKSTNGICGRERGRMGNPSHGQRKECCQQTLELTVFARQTKKKKKKKINKANPRIWHPHISVYILRKPPFKPFKKSHAPQHSLQHYFQEPRQRPSKMSTERLKLRKDLVLIDNGLSFSNEKLALKLWSCMAIHL